MSVPSGLLVTPAGRRRVVWTRSVQRVRPDELSLQAVVVATTRHDRATPAGHPRHFAFVPASRSIFSRSTNALSFISTKGCSRNVR